MTMPKRKVCYWMIQNSPSMSCTVVLAISHITFEKRHRCWDSLNSTSVSPRLNWVLSLNKRYYISMAPITTHGTQNKTTEKSSYSIIPLCRLKLPVTRPFVQQVVQTGIKIKISHLFPFCRESTSQGWIHRTKGPVMRKERPWHDVFIYRNTIIWWLSPLQWRHNIMTRMASQITSLTDVYSTVYSDADK